MDDRVSDFEYPVTRILLVDDESSDRKMIRRCLEQMPFPVDVEECATNAEGLAKLVSHRSDCILVDLQLPDGNAMELIDAPGKHSFIALTSQANERQAIAALQRGAQDYLVKEDLDANSLSRSIRYAIERKRGEMLRDQLAHSDRLASLGRLAASVAHEINNPSAYLAANLTVLLDVCSDWRDFLHVMERQSEHSPELRLLLKEHSPATRPEETLDMLRDSLGGLERISTIVRQLRSFSRRPDEDEPTEPVSLTEIASWACVLTQTQVSHRARFERDLDADIPSFIGRPGRLAQVATNLLVNAAYAVPEGNPEGQLIRVSTYVRDGFAVLCVEDSGSGMSDAIKQRALEPFFTTKPHGEGTGLGLAIAADIVRSHGGQLVFEDRKEGGTRVVVRIPLQTGIHQTLPPESSAVQPAMSKKLRILLIDDEPSIRRAYRRLLAPHEVVALEASDALTHTLVGGDQRFDVVVCDLMMPGIDGVAIYERFQKDAPELASRTIFCTGGVFGERTRTFVARTGRPVLEKPVSKDALVEAARSMLERESIAGSSVS